MAGRGLPWLGRAGGDAGAPPAHSRGRGKAASLPEQRQWLDREVGRGSVSQPGRGHASSSQGLGNVPALDPAPDTGGEGAGGWMRRRRCVLANGPGSGPCHGEKLPACGWHGGALAGLFLPAVCEPGETSQDGKAEQSGWGEAELGCAAVGVCADPHRGEGTGSRSWERARGCSGAAPESAPFLAPGKWLLEVPTGEGWQSLSGWWHVPCCAREPAWEARAVPRGSREYEPPMENME